MSETDKPQVQQLRAVVHGRVQGVGFRATTISRARALGLRGWVRNQYDGTVETVAVGEKALLDQFLAFLHEGPPAARVEYVNTHWSETVEQFPNFDMR